MTSKYAVYANVTKVTCHDGKERYLILCPDYDMLLAGCPRGCPFDEYHSMVYKCDGEYMCHLNRIKHDDNLCDTFDEVRKIIEEAYGTR